MEKTYTMSVDGDVKDAVNSDRANPKKIYDTVFVIVNFGNNGHEAC